MNMAALIPPATGRLGSGYQPWLSMACRIPARTIRVMARAWVRCLVSPQIFVLPGGGAKKSPDLS